MKVILYSLWESNKIFIAVRLKNIYFFFNLGHNAFTAGVFMENGKPTKNNLNAARRNKKKLNLDKNIAKVKLKKTTHMLAYTCKDMCGRKHDVKELRDRRYRGVMKGIKFMQHFFRKNQYKALYAIGDDAPSIFFEMSLSGAILGFLNQ